MIKTFKNRESGNRRPIFQEQFVTGKPETPKDLRFTDRD
jgi:hypothetical protein